MKLYRLHTENKHKKWICQLVAGWFSGFSIYEQTGYWNGKKERSLCIEICTGENSAAYKIEHICKAICGYNKQESVMVQVLNVELKV